VGGEVSVNENPQYSFDKKWQGSLGHQLLLMGNRMKLQDVFNW
jgi:hypothetical protein